MALSFRRKRPGSGDAASSTEAVPPQPPEKTVSETTPPPPKKKFRLSKRKAPKFKFDKRTAFVLLIGDDGAILIFLQKGVVEGRWYAPEAKEEHFELFKRAIVDHPNVPFLVFLDTLDQTYIQQNLPPVNKMGLSAIMKRRLRREFANSEIKGARVLGREKGKKEWLFQMISADATDTVSQWLTWIVTTPNRCIGIRLLPLEMEAVIRALYQKTSANPNTPTHAWLYLLSHQKVSGFRQVILRDGKMIFTRVGQTLQGVSDVIAGLVEQEINSTVEYLKRLGLREAEDLHLHIIASQEVLQTIDPKRAGVKSFVTSTPHQTAEWLQLVNATQPNDRYGDMVTASAAARLRRPTFNTLTKTLGQLLQLHRSLLVVRVLPVIIAVGFVGSAGIKAYDAWGAYGKKSELAQKKQTTVKELASVEAEMATIDDVEKIKDVMDVLRAIEQREMGPETFLLRLSAAKERLGPRFQFNGLDWKIEDPFGKSSPPMRAANGGVETKIYAKVDVIFTTEPKQSNEEIQKTLNEALASIGPLFDGYKITFAEIPEIKPDAVPLGGRIREQQAVGRDIVTSLSFNGVEKSPDTTTQGTP